MYMKQSVCACYPYVGLRIHAMEKAWSKELDEFPTNTEARQEQLRECLPGFIANNSMLELAGSESRCRQILMQNCPERNGDQLPSDELGQKILGDRSSPMDELVAGLVAADDKAQDINDLFKVTMSSSDGTSRYAEPMLSMIGTKNVRAARNNRLGEAVPGKTTTQWTHVSAYFNCDILATLYAKLMEKPGAWVAEDVLRAECNLTRDQLTDALNAVCQKLDGGGSTPPLFYSRNKKDGKYHFSLQLTGLSYGGVCETDNHEAKYLYPRNDRR